jgi:predicted O-methyltransferase YrrM
LGFNNQILHAAWSYAKYLYKGNSAHSIHSPFVFRLYNEAIKKKGKLRLSFPEGVREGLLKNENVIELKGFGAGSRSYSTKSIKVRKHAKHSLKSTKECALTYYLIKFLEPRNILELGTSFGVSTLYLNEAVPAAQITTLEAEPVIAELAQNKFLNKKINSLVGDIDDLLPDFLASQTDLDCVIFDANHSYEATMRYFELCLQKVHNDSFFIVDDIYWSKGMTEAWEEIKKDPKVKVSIDMYYFGVVFFRKEQPEEHFVLRQFQLIQ